MKICFFFFTSRIDLGIPDSNPRQAIGWLKDFSGFSSVSVAESQNFYSSILCVHPHKYSTTAYMSLLSTDKYMTKRCQFNKPREQCFYNNSSSDSSFSHKVYPLCSLSNRWYNHLKRLPKGPSFQHAFHKFTCISNTDRSGRGTYEVRAINYSVVTSCVWSTERPTQRTPRPLPTRQTVFPEILRVHTRPLHPVH